jgi:7,8-dihydropterin-6-yl-methyl-4-(beta-D-ribofuranosyl)aminobenzene 5'-phosphate synthase
VLEGVYVTGEIPRVTDYEDTGGLFFLDADCSRTDPLADDQALYFDTADGVVILLGCAHSGVVNTMLRVRELTGGRPLHAVLGGMHLLEADEHRVERTFTMFRELGVSLLGPAHCTGVMATARLRTEFRERAVVCAVGSSLRFQQV